MNAWGYKLIDEIAWIKKTVNGKIAKGHGFYLQHAKETCLVGIKVTLFLTENNGSLGRRQV
jgi:mRNA (2'-O-methyladenosine-N6-)-methyltransferase